MICAGDTRSPGPFKAGSQCFPSIAWFYTRGMYSFTFKQKTDVQASLSATTLEDKFKKWGVALVTLI